MNMHELKVTTSTIHKDQSTVIMSFKHLHTRTRRERAKRAHSLYIIYTNTNYSPGQLAQTELPTSGGHLQQSLGWHSGRRSSTE